MPCYAPVNVSVGSHIDIKGINEFLRAILVCCAIFPVPALVDTGQHSRVGILALDGIIAHTKCLLILKRKVRDIKVSREIPRIIVVDLIADNPVSNQSCRRIAVA